MKGLAKEEFVTARKEKAEMWLVVKAQHLLSLPPWAQTAQGSWVSGNTCEKCVCVHTWTICKSEHGLEKNLYEIKSRFLFTRSCTKFCYVHFLQHIVTNVGRNQPLCQDWGSGSSWNRKVIHLLLRSPFSKVENFLVTKTPLHFWWNTIPFLLQWCLFSFLHFPVKMCFHFTWKSTLVKLQPLACATPLGHIQYFGKNYVFLCTCVLLVVLFCLSPRE